MRREESTARAIVAAAFVVVMGFSSLVVFTYAADGPSKPCRTDKGMPGLMKMSNCVPNLGGNEVRTEPAKPRCEYGQAGCVLGRRDVEKILKERGGK